MDPISIFEKYFQEAKSAGQLEPEAVVLSTATKSGIPSGRVMLYRGIIDGGFAFYTNYRSRKSKELLSNPRACLTFFWVSTWRQIRIDGRVIKLSPEQSDAYWQKRPRGSQLSACASPQSQHISSFESLRDQRDALEIEFKGKDVPRPNHWGGFKLVPKVIEFWKSGGDRFHERVVYSYENKTGKWNSKLLAP